MKGKGLKLMLGVSLAVVVAMLIPLISGCTGPSTPSPEPTPTPSPEPGEPTPEPTPEPAQELPTYNWRCQVAWAPAETQAIARPWLDMIEGASGDRITFELFSAGELMPQDQVIPAIQAGTLDFALMVGLDVAEPVDIAEIECFPPFLWNNGLEAHAMWDYWGLDAIWTEAYEELGGIKFIGMQMHDPIHLISTKPINTYEDLDGLKINAFKTVARPFTEAGATSVVLPVEEYYLGAQTGVVEGLIWCGATEATNNGWNEVMPYFLTNPVNGNALCWVVMNKDLWDSLDQCDQNLITLGHRELQIRNLAYYYEHEPKRRTTEYWTELTTLPDEDWQRLVDDQWAYYDEIATQSPRLGEAIRIFKEYNALVEEAKWWR